MPVRPPSNERGMNAPYLQHLEDSPLPLYAHPSPSLLGFGRYASLLLVPWCWKGGQRGESLLTQELIRP